MAYWNPHPVEKEKENPDKQLVVHADVHEKESGIPQILRDWGLDVVTQSLSVADYVLSDEIALERKSGNDFVSSLFGEDKVGQGRLFNQVRMLKETYSKPGLIIEGSLPITFKTKAAIRGAELSVLFDYGMPILFTNDCGETAEVIRHLARREQQERRHGVVVHHSKKGVSPKEQVLFIASSLPGASGELGHRIMLHFKTLRNLFNSDQNTLQEVKGVGQLKSRDWVSLFDFEYREK